MKTNSLVLSIFLFMFISVSTASATVIDYTGTGLGPMTPSEYGPQGPDWENGFDIPSFITPDILPSRGDMWQVVADDFWLDGNTTITDIHWWGSFLGDGDPNIPINNGVPVEFEINFWTDFPADPQDPFSYSMPAEHIPSLTIRDIVPGFIDGYQNAAQHNGYAYDYVLPSAITLGEGVYWISIAAINPIGDRDLGWGWKTSDTGWNDVAVEGISEFGPWGPVDIAMVNPFAPDGTTTDMAFNLTTVPEPSTYMLFGSGILGLLFYRRKKEM